LLHKGGLPLALWVSKFFWIKCLEVSLTLAQNFGRVSAYRMASSGEICRLYRQVLRSGASYKDYNFREYTLRKAKIEFRRPVTSPEEAAAKYTKGLQEVKMLNRQVLLSQLYEHKISVIESPPSGDG